MFTQVLIIRYMIRSWETGLIGVGTILLIQIYVLKLFDRLMFIGNSIKKFYQVISEASEMLEIMDTPHEIQNRTHNKMKVHDGRIVLDNVDFSYIADTKVFE